MFTSQSTALTLVKNLVDLDLSDNTYDDTLNTFLVASAGNIGGVTEYRPFIVASKFLLIKPKNDGITSSSGTDTVTFIDQEKVISNLLSSQRSLDKGISGITQEWSCIDANKLLHTFGAFVV